MKFMDHVWECEQCKKVLEAYFAEMPQPFPVCPTGKHILERQKGKMENLLDGLDKHAQFLSRKELSEELQERGIDVGKFLKKAHEIIEDYKR